jgi:hypothetical protein
MDAQTQPGWEYNQYFKSDWIIDVTSYLDVNILRPSLA